MKIERVSPEGVAIITPKVLGDTRGWFAETFREDLLKGSGFGCDFVQDNHSFSAQKGTLRGLHFQNYPYAQTKLVRCTRGAILDVAVDIRKGSPTYKQYIAVELSAENHKQLLVPRGFAHGFVTLTDNTEVMYKVDNPYVAEADRSVRFDDPELNIDWGCAKPILSAKDQNAPMLKSVDCNYSLRVLVTGASGQLGKEFVCLFNSMGCECLGVSSAEMDVRDGKAVRKVVTDYSPDWIIHCAAYTNVDKAEIEREKCYNINVDGTANVAAAAKECGSGLVYLSSDYVYGGIGHMPIAEDAPTNPTNHYGKTKLLGEREVLDALDKYYIIRTSWVFGKYGNNFVKTMLNLAKEKKSWAVVADQYGSPTYTEDLAHIIINMMFSDKYGIYNVTNEGFCSWYDFACEIVARCGKEAEISRINSIDYGAKAVRPNNSRLSKSKLVNNGWARLPTWQDALRRFVGEGDI